MSRREPRYRREREDSQGEPEGPTVAGMIAAALLIAAAAADPVAGTWEGTSLCQVKPSPCHDEVTVYRIARLETADSASVDARKIVNGVEQPMGVLTCRLTTTAPQLTCEFPRGVWAFTIRGDSLTAELRLPDGTKFRDVRAVRSR